MTLPPLFRAESLHSQQQAWLGRIQVVQPVGLRWLTFGVLVALAAAGTFLFWAELPRTATLSGVLSPDRGLLRVAAPALGQVDQIAAQPGQPVKRGDRLMRLQVDAVGQVAPGSTGLQASFEARRKSLAEARQLAAEQAREQLAGLQSRLRARLQAQAQLAEQARQLQARVRLAQQSLQRQQALKDQAFVAEAALEPQQSVLLGLQAESLALEAQRETLAAEVAALQAETRELPLKTAGRDGELAREDAEVAELAAREEAQASTRQLWVHAPADGVLTALHASPGQPVSAGAVLASVTPAASSLQAQLFAPSSAVGFLNPGQVVRLRIRAYPFAKFGSVPGRLLSVDQAPVDPSVLAWQQGETGAGSAGRYRVLVSLPAPEVVVGPELRRPLLAGMEVDAEVLLERRRLVEWLAEPLLAWWRR